MNRKMMVIFMLFMPLFYVCGCSSADSENVNVADDTVSDSDSEGDEDSGSDTENEAVDYEMLALEILHNLNETGVEPSTMEHDEDESDCHTVIYHFIADSEDEEEYGAEEDLSYNIYEDGSIIDEFGNEVDLENFEVSDEILDKLADVIDQSTVSDTNGDSDVDGSSITLDDLAEYSVDYEDMDGYKFHNILKISPIFRGDSFRDLVALWELLGGHEEEIPVDDSWYSWSSDLEYDCNQFKYTGAQYVIGTVEVKNITENFSITEENSRSITFNINLCNEDGTRYNEYSKDSKVNNSLYYNGASFVFYSESVGKYKSFYLGGYGFILGKANVTSDHWGPVKFLIAIPDKMSPNTPDGYDYSNAYFHFGDSNEVFKLDYYEDN